MKAAETAMSTAVSFGGTLSKHFSSKSLSNLAQCTFFSGPLLYLPLLCRGDFFCTTTPASFSNQRFRQHSTRWYHFHRYKNAHFLNLPCSFHFGDKRRIISFFIYLLFLANLVKYVGGGQIVQQKVFDVVREGVK